LKIVVVDYSELSHSGMPKAAVTSKQNGKFVQLRHKDTEYLVFSPRELASYHADIVERFCREKEIPGVYDASGKRFVINDPAWVIVGGGKFEIDKTEKYILMYNNSMAYGRFESKGLKDKIGTIKELKGYEVRIG
jgi:hypothetical protein